MITVGVAGAGAMGSGIAQVALANGHPVVLADADEGVVARAATSIVANTGRRTQSSARARMSYSYCAAAAVSTTRT